MPRITPARRPGDIVAIRSLLQQYFASIQDHIPASDAQAELAGLPGDYKEPGGLLLIAWSAGRQVVGCVGIRPLPIPGACELKRLYVSEAARGLGLGKSLLTAAIQAASAIHYDRMFLDTLPTMGTAAALYRSAGFQPTPPYAGTGATGLLCFVRALSPNDQAAPPASSPGTSPSRR